MLQYGSHLGEVAEVCIYETNGKERLCRARLGMGERHRERNRDGSAKGDENKGEKDNEWCVLLRSIYTCITWPFAILLPGETIDAAAIYKRMVYKINVGKRMQA